MSEEEIAAECVAVLAELDLSVEFVDTMEEAERYFKARAAARKLSGLPKEEWNIHDTA